MLGLCHSSIFKIKHRGLEQFSLQVHKWYVYFILLLEEGNDPFPEITCFVILRMVWLGKVQRFNDSNDTLFCVTEKIETAVLFNLEQTSFYTLSSEFWCRAKCPCCSALKKIPTFTPIKEEINYDFVCFNI